MSSVLIPRERFDDFFDRVKKETVHPTTFKKRMNKKRIIFLERYSDFICWKPRWCNEPGIQYIVDTPHGFKIICSDESAVYWKLKI